MSLAKNLLGPFLAHDIPNFVTRFDRGELPLSTPLALIESLTAYFAAIYGIESFMRPRKAFRLKNITRIYNAALSFGSLVLLLLILEEAIPNVLQHGFYYGVCSANISTPRLKFYYVIVYYSKIIEFADTVLLALKKKPLTFLHLFHHSMTYVFFFTLLIGTNAPTWLPTSLNLTVHVFLYYYYFAATTRKKIWWKKYVTTIEIIQFIISAFVYIFIGWNHHLPMIFANIPSLGKCAVALHIQWMAPILTVFLLGLFIDFYIKIYLTPRAKSTTAQQ
ncbi:hypothetical protein M422DRAFT_165415 [Sphaerobolus stellatus SS14]|uniref:Elongation of fatty acids protein n=1 Tax=Sphaerobolus stellatus (strain SS14) TaxID=990650 RepID=A0A0C9VUC5_SPHS4|nr:hypothetical protein M422DRAFT_165415 [Sphaerobolus stellatus SS14]